MSTQKLLFRLLRRAVDPDDPELDDPDNEGGDEDDTNPVAEEIFASWALFILLFLLASALYTSYFLQQRKIQAVHETVLSIFYGMIVGLIIRISPGHYIQDTVTFKPSFFFNVLLPPIILNSGYELHQANFFRNIGSILTFAISGTFISAIVLGIIEYLWTSIGLEGINLSFIDALSIGATLSATDPVTILSIFNAYKVDPKLYTIIFGESLLNDAISIVMFETCQKFHGKAAHIGNFFQGIGLFTFTFTISLVIGVIVGIIISLVLKHSHLRRYPQIETCLVLIFAYQSYFFSNGCHMSGIVSILFCGITLKHYAYYNMSRRTQIAIKYSFQLFAQLSENFIFIYLGLSLFTDSSLVYKPMFIIVTTIAICIARWAAVFPLSKLINSVVRAKHGQGSNVPQQVQDEIPHNYQMMIFWAGLRGAVGVALARGIQGENASTVLATVLVVVVLTVILFGGTTAGMLEILEIKTGCIDEAESDDEFDIEAPKFTSGTRTPGGNHAGIALNHNHRSNSQSKSRSKSKSKVQSQSQSQSEARYSGNYDRNVRSRSSSSNSSHSNDYMDDDDAASDVSDIPPMSSNQAQETHINSNSESASRLAGIPYSMSTASISGLLSREEHARWFTDFDENVIKPVLLDHPPTKQNDRK